LGWGRVDEAGDCGGVGREKLFCGEGEDMVRAGIAAGVPGDGLAGVGWNPPPGRACKGVPGLFRSCSGDFRPRSVVHSRGHRNATAWNARA